MRGRVLLELKGTGGESGRPGSNPGCGTWNICYTLPKMPDLKVGSQALPDRAVLWIYNETQHMRTAWHIVGTQH